MDQRERVGCGDVRFGPSTLSVGNGSDCLNFIGLEFLVASLVRIAS